VSYEQRDQATRKEEAGRVNQTKQGKGVKRGREGRTARDHRAGDHESSSMCIQRVAKYQEFDLVDGSIPSATEKQIVVQQEPVM
jgi:hypothetical protein